METTKMSDFKDLRKPLKRTQWTKAEDDELKQLWAMKRDDVMISKTMGRSEDSIMMRRSKLGLVRFRRKVKSLDIRKPAPPLKKSPLDFEALTITQAVLNALGYKLTIVKLG